MARSSVKRSVTRMEMADSSRTIPRSATIRGRDQISGRNRERYNPTAATIVAITPSTPTEARSRLNGLEV